MSSGPALRSAVEWIDGRLEVIDQTLLPARLEVRELRSVADVVDAIRRLVVRGAPAIGVCGAFGVVVGLRERQPQTTGDVGDALVAIGAAIRSARPTAVNLAWAVDRVIAASAAAEAAEDVVERAIAEALRIRDEDRESCRRIAGAGRRELASASRILTHCNTGRLATAGIGTALGVIYAKAEAGEPVRVVATETRPLLQGARLTVWELREAGIPVTLISDAAAGAALATGMADAVLVGCDRVARNGDVANKIGTYQLAVLAKVTGVPFYVAGPLSSFDPAAPDGASIEIEFRSPEEITGASPGGPEAWNPAFDITGAEYVTAFITDAGVLRPPYEESIGSALAEATRV
jgi:methylthioribose-1-phosphate isomerase